MPKLFIVEGGQESVFELFDDEVSIGRGAANAIQVADSHASKHHAVVRRVGGRPKLVDLESKNGTRVNGTFANQRWLSHGDTVTIGAAVLRYDATDAGRAPAVEYRAAPARLAASPAAAPAVAAYAPPSAAYVPPPPAYVPAPVAAPPSRRRRDEYDEDEEEERPRKVASRGSNSAAIGILVGAGVIAGIAALFFLLSHSGANKNVEVLTTAKRMAAKDKAAALAYIERNGDPSSTDSYASLAELKESLKKQIEDAKVVGHADEAFDYYKHEIYNAWIEQHKNGISNQELARRITEWRAKYAGTAPVMEFDNASWDPFPKLRALLQQNSGGTYNLKAAEDAAQISSDADALIGRYGDAIHTLEGFRNAQKTLLSPEDYRGLENRMNGKIAGLNERARKNFEEVLALAKKTYQGGEKARARSLMDAVIAKVGIAEIVRDAQSALDSFK